MSAERDDPTVFIGSVALIDALYETYVEHIAISETEGPDGPYLWCACGWRSDDLDGHGTRSDNPGMSYAVHLTNAQHGAAVKALQPIVRRILPPDLVPCTCGAEMVPPYPNDTGPHSTTECPTPPGKGD